MASKYGYRAIDSAQAPGTQILVNVTPLGMQGADENVQSFDDDAIAAADLVFDVVALPAQTPLIRASSAAGTPVVTGAQVIALQAAAQFEKYTGRVLTADQVARASEFSRSET